ncbi:Periplasmic thiol:disulfide interchange protein DsbA [Candidatus Burkholderia brachyanthoides]|nr:Periplasmic thiol:disulfide interchange protein DsbA [Candidatus Burkholderia brachyanthoides]
MKKLFSALALSLGIAAASMSVATTVHAVPTQGKDYTVLQAPRPIGAPDGKVKVIEFFWYGCPHCNEFEPYIEAWEKKQGPDVVFKRVPVAFRDDFIPHSKMYHALVALGVAEKVTPAVFNEIHVKKNYLLTPQAQAVFLKTQGIDPKKYMDVYNSFSTQSDIQRDSKLLSDYHIDGVPTVVVQDKYVTVPAQTNSLKGTTDVLDFLIQHVRDKKM